MKLKQWLCLLLAILTLLSVTGCFSYYEKARESEWNKRETYDFPTADPSEKKQETEPTEPTESETAVPQTDAPETEPVETEPVETQPQISEDGVYDDKDSVALYIHLYGHLPSNYITKKEAQSKGWPGGALESYCPGKCIGGSHFGNYEGQLPDAPGRKYTECDIDTMGAKSRGAKRIVFSNDGLIYYTDDHYEHFELLYGGN